MAAAEPPCPFPHCNGMTGFPSSGAALPRRVLGAPLYFKRRPSGRDALALGLAEIKEKSIGSLYFINRIYIDGWGGFRLRGLQSGRGGNLRHFVGGALLDGALCDDPSFDDVEHRGASLIGRAQPVPPGFAPDIRQADGESVDRDRQEPRMVPLRMCPRIGGSGVAPALLPLAFRPIANRISGMGRRIAPAGRRMSGTAPAPSMRSAGPAYGVPA